MADEIKTITKTTETVKAAPAVATPPPNTPRPPVESAPTDSPSLLSNVLAIVGFIILIVIVIWGLIHLAQLASPWFSSLFGNSAPASIEVQAPASATSGESFTVSWNYSTAQAGTYDLLYQCNDDLRFATTGANGSLSAIPCGAAFAAPSGATSMTVTPQLTGTSTIAEPITILFLPSATGGEQAQGHATVSITPGASMPAVQTSKPVTVSAPHAAGGIPDLSVHILSSNVNSAGVATFVFDIENIGSGASGSYTFEAYLPTTEYGAARSSYTYISPLQPSLNPGDHVTSTLTFTQAVPGTVSILVDPNGLVRESNKTNNYASAALSMPYNYTNNGYNTYYSQQYEYSY